MYILLSGGEEEVNMSHWIITEHADSKTEDAVASGWGWVTLCLTVTCCLGFNGF